MKKFLTAAILTIVFFIGILLAMQTAFHTPDRVAESETSACPPESFHETGYYYVRLEQAEQAVYAAIVTHIEMFPKELECASVSSEQLTKVLKAVSLDHPMLYLCDNGGSLINRSGKTFFVPRYSCAREEYDTAKEGVEQIVQSVLAQMPQGTPYENELYLHDYLTAHCRYDETESGRNSSNPAGALLEGSAVCSGYAKAYKLLLDAADIENVLLTGKAGEAGDSEPRAHIWNAVRLDGDWYHTDVTWDDPIAEGEALDEEFGTHNYFNVTDAMLAPTHSDYVFDYPCEEESLFYYRVNHAYLTEETGDVVPFITDLIVTAAENGNDHIDFKCENDSLCQAAVKKLFTEEKLYRAIDRANLKLSRKFSNRSARYSLDETNCRIIIVFTEKK